MSKFVEIFLFSCVSNSLMWQHIKGHKRFRTFAKYLRSLLAECCQVAHLEGCKVIVDAEEKRKELHLCDTLSINDIFSHVQTEHNGSERIISILNALHCDLWLWKQGAVIPAPKRLMKDRISIQTASHHLQLHRWCTARYVFFFCDYSQLW